MEKAVAQRIQKVGMVEIRDANREMKNGEQVFQAQCAAELAIAIGEHSQAFGYVLAFTPGFHHERIIHRHAGHVDAAPPEFVVVLDEPGQVAFRTGRRERPWH